jgi:hypothetical protein
VNIIQFNKNDQSSNVLMELIDYWWAERRGVKIPRVVFSEFGFFAFLESKPIMASFFYPVMGSEVCHWGYQVSNPDTTFDERTAAILEISVAVDKFAKELGFKMIVSYPGNKDIVKRMGALGYKMADEIVTQAFKELN